MKRYVSVDFLRGLAIWMMLILHTLMRWYDRGWIERGEMEGVPVIFLVIFIIVIFFGGSAGFFLMVSAIGNMIAMYRGLERGNSVKTVAYSQIFIGFLLLIFAMLTESIWGYHGTLGEIAVGNYENWTVMLWRFYHMETIHTIAICIIVNGLVQAILSRNEGYKKDKRNIRIYAILAIICIFVTIPIYELLKAAIPGYPMAINPDTGVMVQYPYIGKSAPQDYIILFFFMILGGHPEPLFPFLSISFIGSIIGINLCREKPPLDFPKKGMYVGFIMFMIGAFGTIISLLFEIESFGNFLANFWNIPGLYPNSWLWWFLCTNGGALVEVLLIIRLVEFRGKAQKFASKTIYMRRHGFVAFTIYNYQFFDVVPAYFVYWIFGVPFGMNKLGAQVLILIPLVLLWWHLILKLWEKAEYFGSLEWIMAKISEKIIPSRRPPTGKWWKVSRLDANAYLYQPEWINIVNESEIPHDELKESKLAFKLSVLGFINLLLLFMAFIIAKNSLKEEKKNQYNTRAKILSIIGFCFYAVIIISLCLITGISF
ncbi:MAG: hypothetical protein ACTSPW_06740 [Promethearchaeota archaeon]